MNTVFLRRYAFLALSAGALSALAQTAPSTCTTAPTSITALTLERAVALSGIASTATPAIPTNLLAPLASGALELRQNFTYSPSSNTVTITDFAAQPSSTSPTLPGNINSGNVLSGESFNVDKIYFSCKPAPSVLITGTITQNSPVSPVGNLIGVPAAISFGYSTDSPPKVNNAVVTYAGIASIYSAAATGTLTFPSTSVTPPGSNAGAPIIVVGGGTQQATAQKQIGLDFSGSSSPLNLQFTFAVTQVSPPGPNNDPLPGASSSIPQVAGVTLLGNQAQITFSGGKGKYAFQVKATDSGGRSSSVFVVVDYNGI